MTTIFKRSIRIETVRSPPFLELLSVGVAWTFVVTLLVVGCWALWQVTAGSLGHASETDTAMEVDSETCPPELSAPKN